jgi:type I restriction enzyme S subunit
MTVTKNIKAFYNTEIPEGWSVSLLGELGTFSKGKGILKEQVISDGLPCIRYGEIYTTHNFIIKKFKSFISDDVANESKEIQNGDILFAGSGETIKEIGKAVAYVGNDKAYAGGDIIILSTKKDFNPECLSYALETDFVKKQKRVLGQGNSVVHIYSSDLSKLKIPLPPLPEQKAIAQVLSTADAAIHTTEKLIAQKEIRKKWLMQQLLTGKRRLNSFNSEVKPKVVGQFLKEVSERNKDLKVTKILSVTNTRGFINQSDQFDRSIASEDTSNYKIVKKGQFAYNPSRVNVGSLDLLRNYDKGILSPMYVVFSTNEKQLLADFLYFHLKTQWFYGHIPMFVQGSVRDSLSFDGLCSMKFFIPTIEEQTAITQVLQAADKEISLLKAKAEKLREHKKGLMQALLTGKVRLKVKE